MSTDTLTPDLIDEADRMADWAVDHAAEAGQHPTLRTVREKLDPVQRYHHDKDRALMARMSESSIRAQVMRNYQAAKGIK